MLAKKDKNPRVIFEDSGITENRYICEGKIWNASTLITYCKEQKYPVFKLPLVGIDLSHLPWDVGCLDDFIFHSLRIQKADTKYQIIIDSYGRICDGYHRICKAILENKTEIDAIRIQKMPKPDGYEERS